MLLQGGEQGHAVPGVSGELTLMGYFHFLQSIATKCLMISEKYVIKILVSFGLFTNLKILINSGIILGFHFRRGWNNEIITTAIFIIKNVQLEWWFIVKITDRMFIPHSSLSLSPLFSLYMLLYSVICTEQVKKKPLRAGCITGFIGTKSHIRALCMETNPLTREHNSSRISL